MGGPHFRVVVMTIDHLIALILIAAIPAISLVSYLRLPKCTECGSRDSDDYGGVMKTIKFCNKCERHFPVVKK